MSLVITHYYLTYDEVNNRFRIEDAKYNHAKACSGMPCFWARLSNGFDGENSAITRKLLYLLQPQNEVIQEQIVAKFLVVAVALLKVGATRGYHKILDEFSDG